jgi:hypothetical protein
MSARQWAWAGACCMTMGVVGGCQTHPSQSMQTRPASGGTGAAVSAAPTFVTSDHAVAEPAAADAEAALPDALSRKTQAYAQSLEPAGKSAGGGAVDGSGEASAAGSGVQWGRAHEARTPRAAELAPRVAANAPATLAPSQPAPAARGTPDALPSGARDGGVPAAPGAIGSSAVATLARSVSANALGDVPAILPESADQEPAARSASSSLPAAASPDSAESQVSQRVKQDPHDVAAQLDAQLLLMMKDQPAPQLAAMPSLSSEDQELINTLVDGLTNFRTAVRQDENMLLANKIRPLLDMSDRLRAQAELSVPTMALCRSVAGFGNYEPIVPPVFPAGQENPVLVYCEIENFAARRTGGDLWETNLTQQATLFTETGMLVWKDKLHPVRDQCRNRRHDFFLFDRVRLPANLTIGRYVLKVTVVDLTANRVAEKTVPMEISAGGSGDDANAAMAGHVEGAAAGGGTTTAPPPAVLFDGR